MSFQERLNLHFAEPTKKLILLGGTGTIGTYTLNYLKRISSIQLEGISIHKSIEKLEEILYTFQPKFVCITDENSFELFLKNYRNPKIKFFKGLEGLIDLIENSNADTVLNALVGSVGVEATVRSIELGKKICLANKESLVTAGPILLDLLKKSRASMIPIDSEHNAIFQLLYNRGEQYIKKILLTASGGPFRDYTIEQIKTVTKEQVLQHPNWNMGPKITVDSAGLINKGLEVIEAHYLFGLPYDSIDVKIHRQSYVHGMIQTTDGSFQCLVSPPFMFFPIAYSLHFPDPVPAILRETKEPEDWPTLEFQNIDHKKYPGFSLCMEAGRKGNSAPVILNSANEVAVQLFLEDKIHFTEIPLILNDALEKIPVVKLQNLSILLQEDQKVREFVLSQWDNSKLSKR
ncbi:MAG: 1-deoxy-D-xylulose-5-phosphate reductoisomerase [Leptonema sp. (in: bacteria)]